MNKKYNKQSKERNPIMTRQTQTLYDISRTLSSSIAVWAGDTPFSLQQVLDRKQGDSVNLTTITMSAHTGSHIDAPRHFTHEGVTLEQLDLRPYWGLAQVVTVAKAEGALYPDDFAGYDLQQAPRLLVHSAASAAEPSLFPHDIVYPSADLADYLGTLGILLYGTDAPSMDAVDDPHLPGHNALLRNQICILEGLDLSGVPDGIYELVALPLKIAGGDGSPVRAALRSLA
jgi:arylformamidase